MSAKMNVSEFFKKIIPVQEEQLRIILENTSRIESYKHGDSIGLLGENENYVRFLMSGVVRGYMLDEDGKDSTVCFLVEPGEIIIGSVSIGEKPAEIGFIAILESEVFAIPVRVLAALRGKFREVSDIYINILTRSLSYNWRTKKMLYMKSARERYEWFLGEFPGLIDQVNHGNIASFLNITSVTLSRIRHEKQGN